MKLISLFLLIIPFYQPVDAQETTYWKGLSANPDPIMRHHGAFMDAFITYLQSRPIGQHGTISTEAESINKSIKNETCRVETVSSVTYEGRETITISIGGEELVEYVRFTESHSSDEIYKTQRF